ncbi:hypothetical protein [Thermococcus sp. ES12]|uniref:hypothetical protein n=1 Tax=Thermococcus sp. ES12 TaxID=1638246 RepID=UPI001431B60B|nr:hypothetical protein [Thermococcus sp. ES12]NJE75909.1 hypothetical protein [Thermococcus sp. ES12]
MNGMEIEGLYFKVEPIKDAIRRFEENGEVAVDKHIICSAVKEALYEPLRNETKLRELIIDTQSRYQKELQNFARFYVEFVNELPKNETIDQSNQGDFLTTIDKYSQKFEELFPSLQDAFTEFKKLLDNKLKSSLTDIEVRIAQSINVGNVSPILLLRLNRGTLPNPVPRESQEEGNSPLYICSGPFTESSDGMAGVFARREIRVWVTSMSNFVSWIILSEFIQNSPHWKIYLTTSRLYKILNREANYLTISTKKALNSYSHYLKINIFAESYKKCIDRLQLTNSSEQLQELLKNLEEYDPILLVGTQFTICKVRAEKGFDFVIVFPSPNSRSE